MPKKEIHIKVNLPEMRIDSICDENINHLTAIVEVLCLTGWESNEFEPMDASTAWTSIFEVAGYSISKSDLPRLVARSEEFKKARMPSPDGQKSEEKPRHAVGVAVDGRGQKSFVFVLIHGGEVPSLAQVNAAMNFTAESGRRKTFVSFGDPELNKKYLNGNKQR